MLLINACTWKRKCLRSAHPSTELFFAKQWCHLIWQHFVITITNEIYTHILVTKWDLHFLVFRKLFRITLDSSRISEMHLAKENNFLYQYDISLSIQILPFIVVDSGTPFIPHHNDVSSTLLLIKVLFNLLSGCSKTI